MVSICTKYLLPALHLQSVIVRGFRAPKIWRVELRMNKTFLDGITDSLDTSLSKLREMVKDRKAWRAAVHGVSKSQTWLSNCTEPN